jgi:predicted PurR-regulated permease PerM
MDKSFVLPSGLRFLIIMVNLIIVFSVLHYLSHIFIPIAFAIVISILLYPVCKRLESYNISRLFAIIITLIVIFFLASSILILLSSQIVSLSSDLPSLTDKLMVLLNQFLSFTENYFHISAASLTEILKKGLSSGLQAGGTIVGGLLSSTTTFISSVFIVCIYVFLILYYRNLFSNFLIKIVPDNKQKKVTDLIIKIEDVIYNYISGLMLVIIIIAILNIIGLTLIGIEYAFFFGILAALLTVIPYFGVFIGSAFPIIFAFIMHDSIWYPIGVLILFSVVQFLEGNIITPNIVGSKVQVNVMAAILSLIVGAELWGPAGMVLAIPVIAILKVIFDKIPNLQPFAYLIGGEIHNENLKPSWMLKMFSKIKKIMHKISLKKM